MLWGNEGWCARARCTAIIGTPHTPGSIVGSEKNLLIAVRSRPVAEITSSTKAPVSALFRAVHTALTTQMECLYGAVSAVSARGSALRLAHISHSHFLLSDNYRLSIIEH